MGKGKKGTRVPAVLGQVTQTPSKDGKNSLPESHIFKFPQIKGQFCIFASTEGVPEDAQLGALVGSGTASGEATSS